MLINIGHDNYVAVPKVLALAKPTSAPIKRAISEARKSGKLIDLCAGKACRSVIFTAIDQVILSSLRPKPLRERLNRAIAPRIPPNTTPKSGDTEPLWEATSCRL